MPETALRAWVQLIGRYVATPAPSVLEVGAGTGMFCSAMASGLNPHLVIGVDSSAPMLAQAQRFNTHPAFRYVSGTAEALPSREGAFDLALLSRVVHHLPDPGVAAQDLARALRHGGVVLIRTTFRECLDTLVYDYWPDLHAVDERRFPGERELLSDFASAAFTLLDRTSFAQPVTSSLREYHARLVGRPQSKFTQLTDAEFQHGLRLLEADASAEPIDRPRPVVERYDVMVLEAR